MPRCYFALVLAALTSRVASAQVSAGPAAAPVTLAGTYRLTYQPDSPNAARRAQEILLLLGAGQSLFRSEAVLRTDSLLAVNEALPWNQASAQVFATSLTKLPLIRVNYSVYKTLAACQALFYNKLGLTTYFYAEPAELLS